MAPSEFWRLTPRAFYRWSCGARRRHLDLENNELLHLTMTLKGQGALEPDAPHLELPRADDDE